MSWYICFLASAVLYGVVIKIAVDVKLGKLRVVYIMCGCLAIAYLLYLPPYLIEYDIIAAVLGDFINVLHVISLDADYLQFYGLIKETLGYSAVFSNLYFTLLAVIHFALPAVSAMTAVTIIVQCFTQMRITFIKKRSRTLYIFSAINYDSVVLARDIRRNDKNGDILFLDDKDSSDFSELQREIRCSILDEKIENIKASAVKRVIHYYCISENMEENLNSALAVMDYLENESREIQQNNHVFVFTTDPSAELIIDSIQKGFINVSIIDEYKTVAYRLLEKYPLPIYAVNNEINVLICGFSRISKAFLKAAVWCGQISGYKLSFTVIGKNISDIAADFMAEYPGLFTERYSIKFHSYKNELEFKELMEKNAINSNYIISSGETDAESLEKAVFLRRFFYQTDPEFKNAPVIFAYIENIAKAEAASLLKTAEAKAERRMSYDIIPFGTANEVFAFKSITDSDLENLSKNVHLVYEDIFSDGEIDVISALERYNLFEVNINSNRANALHIRYKLLMLGLDYTEDEAVEEVDLNDYLNDETLKRLTIAEHDRWMAFLETEGWIEAAVSEAETYKKSGISKGRHNCPILKMHPYICQFGELQERSDALGLPDSTVYDRELIVRIPDILHDRWNVSGKRYKIVKR